MIYSLPQDIPHLFHIRRQFNCYKIWIMQNKYATYIYERKCGRLFTATLFQLCMKSQSLKQIADSLNSLIDHIALNDSS